MKKRRIGVTVFKRDEFDVPPRADMFLPAWLLGFGCFLGVAAVGCLVAAFVTKIWILIAAFAVLGALGIAAWLCWRNQTIRIVDEFRFEYTTFLGNKRTYYFSDIKKLRANADSWTLYVGDGKIHIESIVIISEKLIEIISNAVKQNSEASEQ